MADTKCAHPKCKCMVETDNEFCSDECRAARTEGTACPRTYARRHAAG